MSFSNPDLAFDDHGAPVLVTPDPRHEIFDRIDGIAPGADLGEGAEVVAATLRWAAGIDSKPLSAKQIQARVIAALATCGQITAEMAWRQFGISKQVLSVWKMKIQADLAGLRLPVARSSAGRAAMSAAMKESWRRRKSRPGKGGSGSATNGTKSKKGGDL